MDKLKICSYNCRGLNSTKKRFDLFTLFKEKKVDVLCLQETHFTEEIEHKIYQQWEGVCFYSHGSSNSKGVAILLRKGLDIKVAECKKDNNGQFIALNISYENNSFILGNIYAPNSDKPDFFKNVFDKMKSFDNVHIFIICGDFNLVLDPSIDYENYKYNNHNEKSRKFLITQINDNQLVDPFRHLHGAIRKYTWKMLSPLQKGRLDFFLIDQNLLSFVRNCDIDISYRSDHSIIVLELQFSKQEHGKGFWKFNNSLLKDKEYVDCINKKIDSVILQYCLPVYNTENVLNIDKSQLQFIIDDQLFLETLLMEIRGETISFSTYKAKTKCIREDSIKKEISYIENNLNETNKDRLSSLQLELETLRKERLNGSFIRSRSNWIDNREKVTNYFCNLEKQHVASKTMHYIEKEDGIHIFDQKEILKETKQFYENLYTEPNNVVDFDLSEQLAGCSVKTINENQKKDIEGLLQYNEVTDTLKNMKNDKSPGNDGFTSIFYKLFWNKIGHFVVKALNYAFISKSFSRNVKLGTITCIPKENKERQFLKNWRPITLLNVLYKLASGSIA